jgi:hypothetical protein
MKAQMSNKLACVSLLIAVVPQLVSADEVVIFSTRLGSLVRICNVGSLGLILQD